MLRLYLSQTGRHSCLGSEKPREIIEYLVSAGVKASEKQLRRMLGYFWIHVAGDNHFRVMRAAHGGIPRQTYQDLAQLGLSLLGRRLGEKWHFSSGNRIPGETERSRRAAAQREIKFLEVRRAL